MGNKVRTFLKMTISDFLSGSKFTNVFSRKESNEKKNYHPHEKFVQKKFCGRNGWLITEEN